jgi:hypothetical protein
VSYGGLTAIGLGAVLVTSLVLQAACTDEARAGTYTYLCSAGGYWRTQNGTLVVR